ncbi:TetR/AcrR family transcriptional regulator [Kribbella sp. NPDC056345]|uniref:TetR/AcrR family transcriptional regulator n=1 Tax=Kribbella sp. NPDC056345 TaxID=3345789 RepID=UPI0035E243DA
MATGDEHATPPLRSDAERNRERVLAAARAVFARDGLGASMASVAREAGVGIATLFRRFPAKEDLVAAVFADRMDAYAETIETALADADPWRGFTGFLEKVCAMQAADRGFADVLTMSFPTAKPLEARRRQAYEGFVQLIDRAKASGRLREDFVSKDLVLLLMATAGVINATGQHAPDGWRRVLAFMIQSYEAPARAPLPDGPTDTALYRAMLSLGSARSPSL